MQVVDFVGIVVVYHSTDFDLVLYDAQDGCSWHIELDANITLRHFRICILKSYYFHFFLEREGFSFLPHDFELLLQ